jgi:predicted PhzF superfamily epimerase YddE/YHI9
MDIPIFQVDAFTSRLFGGNPAAVCPLEAWLPDSTLQSIAAENNLAETAFLVPLPGGRFDLRWFTPTVEVDLCGHATLASAHVLFHCLGQPGPTVQFDSRSGPLSVARDGDLLTLDFPALPLRRCSPDPRLVEGLGVNPLECYESMDYMVVLGWEADVRGLKPHFPALAELSRRGVIATARGVEADFVSRFFAPAAGIDEDPVTGSAHCALTPYWSKRLGKTKLRALQLSARGGELWVEDRGDRIAISGRAVPYLRGTITV